MNRSIIRIAYVVFACAILLGAYTRVADVNVKTLFSDEAFSILRITGHTEAAYRLLVDDRARPMSAVAAFQRVDAGTSPSATLRSIGSEEPQRGPLYYTLASLWVRVAGTSVAGFRSLGVAIGLLTIGAAFLFGWVAFRDRLAGAALAALVAVSPFHVAYAMQAREYGLFTFCIFACGAACVFALRRATAGRWIAYAATAAAGLLTTPFFALVVVSFALYVAYIKIGLERNVRAVVPFAVATTVAAIVAAPWFVYAANASHKVSTETSWGLTVFPPAFYLAKLAFNFGAVFFDYEFAVLASGIALAFVVPSVCVLFVIGVKKNGGAFALASLLAIPTIVILLANDVRSGSHFGTIARYATPVWVAIEIAVVAGIVVGLRSSTTRTVSFAAAAAAILIASGAFCAFADAKYAIWWDTNDNVPIRDVARELNARPHATVLVSKLPLALVLVHYLDESICVQLYSDATIPVLSSEGNPNALFVPIGPTRETFRKRLGASAMHQVVRTGDAAVVSQFHAGLVRAKGYTGDDSYADISATNALWVIDAATRAPKTR